MYYSKWIKLIINLLYNFKGIITTSQSLFKKWAYLKRKIRMFPYQQHLYLPHHQLYNLQNL